MKLIDYIVNVFVMADDFCKTYFPDRSLRASGPLPKLADSEVITMELVGEYMGFDTDQRIYQYFDSHWRALFNRIIRKILSHTVCVVLNIKMNIDPLKLRLLVN